MPMKTIRRFIDPMSFVWKVDELARNTLSLKCLKQFMSLSDGAAKIKVIMNDQHWRFVLAQIARQSLRTELSVFFRQLPRQSTVLVFVEP
jgi:hypothetical protein